MYLTPEELAALISAGWTYNSGPFPNENDCLVNCGSSSSLSDTTFTCSDYPEGMSANWCFTISGITDGLNCTSCSSYNGTFTLRNVEGGGCCFVSDVILPCSFIANPNFGWVLYLDSGSWFLAVGDCGNYNATYGPISIGSFNPFGPNIFNINDPTINNNCTNLPLTVTVSPC